MKTEMRTLREAYEKTSAAVIKTPKEEGRKQEYIGDFTIEHIVQNMLGEAKWTEYTVQTKDGKKLQALLKKTSGVNLKSDKIDKVNGLDELWIQSSMTPKQLQDEFSDIVKVVKESKLSEAYIDDLDAMDPTLPELRKLLKKHNVEMTSVTRHKHGHDTVKKKRYCSSFKRSRRGLG